jgi:primase-polymerase (primpol)-like protein
MTEKEKAKQALNEATNHEISILHKKVFGTNPFQNLLLPSTQRKNALKNIFQAIDSGALKFDKN